MNRKGAIHDMELTIHKKALYTMDGYNKCYYTRGRATTHVKSLYTRRHHTREGTYTEKDHRPVGAFQTFYKFIKDLY